MKSDSFSPFADTVRLDKYSHVKGDGTKETWAETAHRVATSVMSAVPAHKSDVEEIECLIRERKFMPGGRYLAAAGRPFHQTQNCLLLRAQDSRFGWSDLLHKSSMALMTGAGIGVVYSDLRPSGAVVRRTGGVATGPLALMQMLNEVGRGIRQGGSRRSAIWAGLHWSHQDSDKFIRMKDWIPEVRALKEKDYDFPATMDGTNISMILDDEFFEELQSADPFTDAKDLYEAVIKRMLKTGEPGFSVDIGKNSKENLRNAPVCADTHVLTDDGYLQVRDIVDRPVTVWTGKRWASDVVFTKTATNAEVVKVEFTGGRTIRCEPTHEFLVEKYVGAGERRRLERVERVKARDLKAEDILHVALPDETFVPGELDRRAYTLGFVYGDGTLRDNRSDVTICTNEKKPCAARFEKSWVQSVTSPDSRGYDRYYLKAEALTDRTHDQFPEEMYGLSEEAQLSFVAGLFDADGNVDPTQKRIRLSSNHVGFLRGVGRLLEQNGILASVAKNGSSTYGQKQTYQLCVMSKHVEAFARKVPCARLTFQWAEGYVPYRDSLIRVTAVSSDGHEDVYCADVKVEEHSFMAEGVIISNCTEVCSEDTNDICNLGSVNLARIDSLNEMNRVVELGTMFLLAGTCYSDVPYPEVDQVRTKNRRLGLGLMGVHEWLLKRDKPYGPDDNLELYLETYRNSRAYAHRYANAWSISEPVKTRAIAPTGTIGIVAETTTGIEPIFCAAYQRRYKDGDLTRYQYVIDPTAKRLVEQGIAPDAIEDAYTLAEDVERRVAFQAWVQQYVDHGISSTINLPAWGTPLNNPDTVKPFGDMLLKYLPDLRGVTTYPNGARAGQPLSRVDFKDALKHEGEVFTEQMDVCDLRGGSCGA